MALFLTDEEKRILDGAQGEIAQRCMKFLVDYGEAAGAERLVDLDGTVDLHPGSNWINAYDVTKKKWRSWRKRRAVKVPTFANNPPAPVLSRTGGKLRHSAQQRRDLS